MFVPLRDRNSLKTIHFQRVTVGLIVINTIIYLIGLLAGTDIDSALWGNLGFVPTHLFTATSAAPSDWPDWHVPALLTLLTHTFFHENFWHLAGNMLFLWVFGDNVEDALGSRRFLAFYLIGGLAAGLCEGLAGPNPDLPLIGASGAISACIGAYLLLYPRSKIWILLFFRIPVLLPAYWVGIIWVVTQVGYMALMLDRGTAWFAHLGGLIAGMILVVVMRRPGVHLFNPADPKPVPVFAAAKEPHI
ncbi:MAG: rhomboid family intramembrane serine protease [Alphaproteobacteria bacterium]